ncbi:MAG: hypothetical protein EZS28_032591 [Streblomastix strix]|uniref:Uncharacterized protein n=1 Tax=Streblomastix strix TaxID=222440 RepID=A0A5J4UP72_9EUKA|nr:MAG: hypothetical protein EZS28_032591 [Streblomastix strix]
MVGPYIPDKETQWNMEKDSGCEQVEQGNKQTTLQNAWTRGSTISSQLIRLCNIPRSQISISPHHSISKLNFIPSTQFQYQQLCVYCYAFWDQIKSNHLRGSNRVNPQTNKNTFKNQDFELLRRYISNSLRQMNIQNRNNKNNENVGVIQMDNINRQIRNRTEIDNNVPGMDMESEGNEYKDVRREKLKIIQALKDQCNKIYKNKCEKIRQLAALICRPNLLRSQIKEASLYLVELDKAKIYALKKKSWDVIMIVNRGIIRELKWWIRKIENIQPVSLINKTIICMLKTDAFSQGLGATRIYKNQIEQIQHDCLSKKEAEMTSKTKEIKAIYYGLLRFEQIFKKMQDQPILIRSESTTTVQDIGNWKAKESLIERTKQVFYLVKRLQLQNTTIHISGKLNLTTDSLSRLCRSGDYTLQVGMIQLICKTLNYMPQIDIFAPQRNKLINNYVRVGLNDLGTHFHNAFNYNWSKVKLYIYPLTPVLNTVLQKMKQDKAQRIIIAPIWAGQLWYTKLKSLSIKFLFFGLSERILEMGQRMKDKDQKLSPGNVGAFLMYLLQMQEETCQ